MPIEFVKSTIEAPKRHFIPLEHRSSTAHDLEEDQEHIPKDESRVDQANSDLRQTMTEIEEIKMYRSVKPRRTTSTITSTTAISSQKPDTKRKVLVGAEFNRFIVSKEKAKMDKININLKRFQDPILEVLATSQQQIADHIYEAKVIGFHSQQLHKGADPDNLEQQRKMLLSQSEQRRKVSAEHPQYVHRLEATRPQDDYVTWAIESSLHQSSKLETQLMQLETTLRKEAEQDVMNTSSSDDEHHKKQHHKGPLHNKPKKSVSRKRREDDNFHTNTREDVGAKLQQDLNQLDRSLYRDMVRKQQSHKPAHHSKVMGGKRIVGRRGMPHFNMPKGGSSAGLQRQGSHSSLGSARSGKSLSRHDSFRLDDELDEDEMDRSERAASEYTRGTKIIKNEDIIKMNQKKQQFEASLRQFGGVDRDGNSDSVTEQPSLAVESMYKAESRPVSTMLSAHPPATARSSIVTHHVSYASSPSRAGLPHDSRAVTANLIPHPPQHPPSSAAISTSLGSAATPHRPNRPSVPHTPSSASRGVSSYGRKVTTPSKEHHPHQISPPHGRDQSVPHAADPEVHIDLHVDNRHMEEGETMQHFLLRQNHTFKRQHIHDVVADKDLLVEPHHNHRHSHVEGEIVPSVAPSASQESGADPTIHSAELLDSSLARSMSSVEDDQLSPSGAGDVSILVFGECEGAPVLIATYDAAEKNPVAEDEAVQPEEPEVSPAMAQDDINHNIVRKMNLIEDMMQLAQQKKLKLKLVAEAQADKLAMYSDDPAKRPGDAFRDDFIHDERATMQYFVSPIHTVASKTAKSTGVEEVKVVPYRDRELRSKHLKKPSKTVSTVQANVGTRNETFQLEHLTCNLAEKRELPPVLERDNNKIVFGYKDKLQGEGMLEEFRNLHVSKASIVEARRARKAIEADMAVVREVVVSVTKKSAQRTKQMKDHLTSIVHNKEARLKETIQSLKDKEFHSPRKFQQRRQEFKSLDEKLSNFLDYTVPTGTTTYYDFTHRNDGEKKDGVGSSSEEDDEGNSEASSGGDRFPNHHTTHHREVFLTQMRGKSQNFANLLGGNTGGSTSSAAGNTAGNSVSMPASSAAVSAKKGSVVAVDASKAVPLSLTQNNLASLIRQFAEQQQHKGQLQAVRQTLHNDLNFCHNYELEFRKVVQRNQAKENMQVSKRILSKTWFLQLLRRIKKYKKSVFNAKIPPSLFLLLGAVKKLIGANVDITKESLWLLVEKTIHRDEFKQNLIYIALQQIFTEVHVHAEEIYYYLRNQHIEIAPKLLMDVKRERKMKQKRDKLIAQSKKQHKQRHHSQIIPKSMPVLHEDGELEITEEPSPMAGQPSASINVAAHATFNSVSMDSNDGASVYSDVDTPEGKSIKRNASMSSVNSDLSVEDGLDGDDNFDYEAWLKED